MTSLPPACAPTANHSVTIAKRAALRIEQILQGRITSQRPDVDLKIQCHVRPTILERLHRPANLMKTSRQVLPLPLPEDPVQVGMMKIEQRVPRTVRRVSDRPQHASDAEMPTPVNVRRRETRNSLQCVREARVVWLTRHVVHQALLREAVHDPRREISFQTTRQPNVDTEERIHERPVENAPAAGTAGQVKWVLLNRGLRPRAVTAEA